jgi:hypothetical protein
VLLALIRQRYAGDARAVDHMKALLDSKGIPCTWENWF